MESAEGRRRFRADVADSANDIDLARAALDIAMEERLSLDIEAYLARLDQLAAIVAPEVAAFPAPTDAITRVRELFAREGFRGKQLD